MECGAIQDMYTKNWYMVDEEERLLTKVPKENKWGYSLVDYDNNEDYLPNRVTMI